MGNDTIRDDNSRQTVEERTRKWLGTSYLEAIANLPDRESVWDAAGDPQNLTGYHFQEIQRKIRIFSWLDRLSFDSFIDVGSGFDIYPKLVQERYGASVCFSDLTHTLNLPYGGAASGKLDRAVTANAARLPFDDGTFDVVLSSEVLEHLVRPIETIAELLRISRKYLIMTSLEALSSTLWQRLRSHFNIDVRQEMTERNFFLLQELDAIFGPGWHHGNLLYNPDLPTNAFSPKAEQEATYATIRDVAVLVEALRRATRVEDHRPGAMGIILLKAKPSAEVGPPRSESDDGLIRWIIGQTAAFERFVRTVARDMSGGTDVLVEHDRPIDAELLKSLRCPDCRERLESAGSTLRCTGCNRTFSSEYGVPILDPAHLSDGVAVEQDCLRRLCGDDRRRQRTVLRAMRRLRRNEAAPGRLRQLLWNVSK